jgi:hypothetical protein
MAKRRGCSASKRSRISQTYAGSLTVQLKSALSHSHPSRSQCGRRGRSDCSPGGVVAAQLDLQAAKAIAPNPVTEEDRVAVLWFGPVRSLASSGSRPPRDATRGVSPALALESRRDSCRENRASPSRKCARSGVRKSRVMFRRCLYCADYQRRRGLPGRTPTGRPVPRGA